METGEDGGKARGEGLCGVRRGKKLQWLLQILLGPSEDCDLYPNKLGAGEGHDLMGFNRMLLGCCREQTLYWRVCMDILQVAATSMR